MDCEDIIRTAIGRGLTDEELLDLSKEAGKWKKRAMAGPAAAKFQAQINQLARQKASQDVIKAIAKKRNAELQIRKKYEAVNYVLDNFKGMEAEGLSAIQVGSKYLRDNARGMSADARACGLKSRYLGGLFYDLRQIGGAVFKMLKSADHELDLYEAIFAAGNPNAAPYNGNPQIAAIAQVIAKWNERARVDANKAGAFIRKLPGYIIKQTHDKKLMEKAGLDEWKNFIRDRLDYDHTANGKFDPATDQAEIDQFLTEVYRNLVTGVHPKKPLENPLAQGSVTGTTAARMSEERVLHFKDGKSAFEYNRKFGKGNLAKNLIQGIEASAKSTALMRTLGPSPWVNFDNIRTEVKAALASRYYNDPAANRRIEQIDNWAKRYFAQMKEIDGSADIAGNPTLAKVGSCVRALESMAKLGGCVISGFSDIPVMASEFAYQGRNILGSMLEIINEMRKGRGTADQQRILANMGVFYDSMCGEVAVRFAGDDRPDILAGAQNIFFKINGLSWWTDTAKKTAGLLMAHDIALDIAKSFSQLSKERARLFKLYGIDSDIWNMLRSQKLDAADGRAYFTPEAAQGMADNEIRAYFANNGRQYSLEAAQAFKDDIEEKLITMFNDRSRYAVLEPDARTRAMVYGGSQSGTAWGEAIRCIMQFTTFSAVFMQRAFGREIYGRGADKMSLGIMQALKQSADGDRNSLAHLIALTTLFGYGSMVVKSLFAGKTPRDPEDPKTWVAAMVQGGGLGIYGDFLFGEASRLGDSFLVNLAGPAFGSMNSVYKMYLAAKEGKDFRAQAFRTLYSHLPGNNLFYTKHAMDRLIVWEFMEMLNPGSTARARRKMLQETGQKYLFN